MIADVMDKSHSIKKKAGVVRAINIRSRGARSRWKRDRFVVR